MAQKILIVDDDPNLIRLLESRLKTYHYSVIVAYSGETCLDFAKQEKPDLIILDIALPKMDGFEVLQALRRDSETNSIPVIMLTQKRDTGSIMDAQSMGCVDYIAKPFEPEELIKLVKRYI